MRSFTHLLASVALCSGLFVVPAFLLASAPVPSYAEVSVGISVTIPPPALPVYVQPPCPGPGYIWTPGYWAWDPDFGYYWVPGTWVLIPYAGWYWTPGYWGWANGAYLWYEGYWGPVVGFYGGINYGFGYNGYGYYGGYWDRGTFYYNSRVNNVRHVPYVYSRPVPRPPTRSRVSFNGGRGGVNLRPTRTQQDAARHRASAPIAPQREQVEAARRDPQLRARQNHGRPSIAATERPGAFHGPGVVSATRAGAPFKESAPPRATHPGARERSAPPAAPATRGRAVEPRREAPAPRTHTAPPAGRVHEGPATPRVHTPAPGGERPAYRGVEPRRQQPVERMGRPPAQSAPMREMPRVEPRGAYPASPAPAAPRMPGGERREEMPHR